MVENNYIVATDSSQEDAELAVKKLQQPGFEGVLTLFEPNQPKHAKKISNRITPETMDQHK